MTDILRVAVIPGEGAIIRQGTALVVIGGAVSSAPHLVDHLSATIADHEGDERVRQLARLVLNVDVPPPLAVATLEGDTATIFLHGDLALVWPTGRVSGSDHVLGITQLVPIADGFWIGAGVDEAPPFVGWSNLVSGVVSGAGVVISADAPWPPTGLSPDRHEAQSPRQEVADAESSQPPPVSGSVAEAGEAPEEVTKQHAAVGAAGSVAPLGVPSAGPSPELDELPIFDSISLAESIDLSDRLPLPAAGSVSEESDAFAGPKYERPVEVIGVFSPRGFFNHPDAKYCSRTGVKMGASRTKVLSEGPRPPLGVLTLDDGSTLSVQWTTIIGRHPSHDERVLQEEAAPFVVSDESQSVSRAHAILELVDWDVLISDLGSSNLTYIELPGESRRQLGIGESTILRSGTTIHIGERSFVYHEHHVR